MKAGKLSRVVKIQRMTETLNDAGTPVEIWADLAKLRAEKVEQSTTEFIRNYGPGDEALAVFRTRFIPGVTNADRLVFAGQNFNIKEIVTLGRDRGYEFRCVRLS